MSAHDFSEVSGHRYRKDGFKRRLRVRAELRMSIPSNAPFSEVDDRLPSFKRFGGEKPRGDNVKQLWF